MSNSSIWVLAATIFVILIILGFSIFISYMSSNAIYKGSGKPISMAKIVLSSTHITGQILFGVFIIGLLCVMILDGKITSDAGLPTISGIAGYLLGKSFKDVYDSSPAKKKVTTEN